MKFAGLFLRFESYKGINLLPIRFWVKYVFKAKYHVVNNITCVVLLADFENCGAAHLITQRISACVNSRGFLKLILTLVEFSELLTAVFGLNVNVEYKDAVLTLDL